MSITLYTAPNCQRCTILKDFLASRGQEYVTYDFQGDKDVFNTFYRAHRAHLHRDAENRLEFPIYQDGDLVRQGIGEILASLLSGEALKPCVGTTGILHGWISGLNVSACPAGEEKNFLILLHLLSKGGLKIILDSDGRRPELLEMALGAGIVTRLMLNVLGPESLYPVLAGGPLPSDDLKKSLALARSFQDAVIRLFITAWERAGDGLARLTPEQAGEAAQWVFAACGDRMLPFSIEPGPDQGLPPLTGPELLSYRAKVRQSMVKAEIRKPESH